MGVTATDYNRYQGNSGRVTRVSQDRQPRQAAPQHFSPPQPGRTRPQPPPGPIKRPPWPLDSLGSGLGGLLEKLNPAALETDDLLLLLILYLLYRESGDTELLLIMGAMFLA